MIFGQSAEDRAKMLSDAIEFAGGYVPRNPEVLQRLRDAVFRPLPPSISNDELRHVEGQRFIVDAICRQYQLAMTGSADTPWQTIHPQPEPQKDNPPPRQPRKRRAPAA